MALIKFWDLKHFSDDIIFEIVNYLLFFADKLKLSQSQKNFLKKNKKFYNIHKNDSGFLVANGPSLKTQNLKFLKDITCFFVNRSFLHEDYDFIKPSYHFIVDNKLNDGTWNINFIDQIFEKNPNVKLFLNIDWFHEKKFEYYKNINKYNLYWINPKLTMTPFHKFKKIDLTSLTFGAGVTGAAMTTMFYMGFKNIYFIGKDGNGLCYELTNRDSHFYGNNPENKKKEIKDIYKDLYMMSLSLKNWVNFENFSKRIGTNIYNCTDGGIFDMFERKKYEDIIKTILKKNEN